MKRLVVSNSESSQQYLGRISMRSRAKVWTDRGKRGALAFIGQLVPIGARTGFLREVLRYFPAKLGNKRKFI